MQVMESVTLENFRCFREKQTVKLAPLTLLVGENSTGKTSLLALIQVLAELATGQGWFAIPDFKRPPFDLGTFDNVAHERGHGVRADTFSAGFEGYVEGNESQVGIRLHHTFGRQGASTVIRRRYVSVEDVWAEDALQEDGAYFARVGTKHHSWRLEVGSSAYEGFPGLQLLCIELYDWMENGGWHSEEPEQSLGNSVEGPNFAEEAAFKAITSLAFGIGETLLFAGAPVRSKPHRTYDPSNIIHDPEGYGVASFLADLASRQESEWAIMKDRLETFGRVSGLFDDIYVRRLGANAGDPFQIQIRKGGRKLKGVRRNLIDVGYGVSQALPLVTELLRPNGARLFLLQQPEVHLHPSAQAELGSLFCEVAATPRQVIVETHGDHLIDRVRMEVRDGTTALQPEDVVMLYFERNELDVKIHEVRFDALGNVCGAPDSYGDFMMQETRRSLGL